MKLRLDRILTSQGLCSRKEAGIAIKKGKVLFNGRVLKSPKDKISTESLIITFDNTSYTYTEHIYIMLNKPAGYECSDAPVVHPSVKDLLTPIHRHRNIMSAGRLDVDTTGLLLFSDDGQFIHNIASPKKHLSKVYQAILDKPLNHQDANRLLKGVRLENDAKLAIALDVQGIDTNTVLITIDEGRYHQVKRMFLAVGNSVIKLHRQQIGDLVLPQELPLGSWMDLDVNLLGLK